MSTGPRPATSSQGAKPSTRALADFELLQEIGSGTTGTVYLARIRRPLQALRAGDRVAVKFLHQHLLDDAAARRRFLREARAGMAVASPHLVRVYAVEEAEVLGQRMLFLAMELVEGSTLRDLLREGPLAEPLVRSVGLQVARGLAALHAAGSAHSDVKPENVVLASGGRAVVMDLGFVRGLAPATDSDLRELQTFTGSLAYAAPERLRNQPPTPRSDVYSLGVLLFELATATRPFDSQDPSAVIRGHLESAPPSASSRHPRVSPFLDAVVAACLEKNPADRIASAEALAAILEQGESSKFWRERLAALSRSAALAARHVHWTPFHGREAELRELQTVYTRVAAGSFRVVDLVGDAGIGKTRLLDEFVAAVSSDEDPPISLYGRCARVGEPPPAEPFAAMLRRYLAIPRGAEPDAAALSKLRLTAGAAAARTLAGALRGVRDASASNLGDAFVEFLRGAAKEGPVVAFLDDADAADEVTEALTASIVRGAPERVLWVVGRRPGASPIERALERASQQKVLTQLALTPLLPAALAAIVDELVEPDPRRVELRDSLVRAAAGNPGHVAEVLRSLRSGGSLVATDASSTSARLRIASDLGAIPIARSSADAVLARLAALEPAERQALELLAVAGDRCDAELLASAFGGEPMTWLRTLARLENPHGLLTSAAGTFRFARPMLHEIIYQSLDEPARAAAHGKLAEILDSRLTGSASQRERLRVAEHARRSGRADLALAHLPRLAEDFRRRGHFERALVLARSTIDLLNRLPRRERTNLTLRFDCLATIAECHSRMGDRREEKSTLEKCARIARYLDDPSRLARTLLSLGRYSQATGRYLTAETYLERAIALAHRAGDARAEAEACVVLSTVAQYTGRIAEAAPLLDRALTLAADRDLRARVLLQQGLRLLNVDRPDLALTQIDEASRIFRELKMPAAEAAAHFHRARALSEFGRVERARKELDRAIALARAAGERRTEAMALSLRGALRAAAREYDGAERELRAAADLAHGIGDRFTECHTAIHLANLYLSTRNPRRSQREAARLSRLALALADELELPRLRALAHAVRARAHLRGSRMAEALAESERALEILTSGPRDRRREAAVLYTRGIVLRDAGRHEEARAMLARAADVIVRTAEGIPDAELRESFLRREPFHRKVLTDAGVAQGGSPG